MLAAVRAALLSTVLWSAPPSVPQRIERLVALARLDGAVRYFNPKVAVGPSAWDSLFAASVVRIADAPTTAEYARLVGALMSDLHDDQVALAAPQHALMYDGFPSPTMQGPSSYHIIWRNAEPGETYRVEMGEGVHAEVRLAESGGKSALAVPPLPVPASGEWRASYPAAGYRMLAAARVWSTIHYFYPYKGLIGENWDDQLRAALPDAEAARNGLEYGKAIAAFASHIHDNHVSVISPVLQAYIGTAPIGAAARLIENELVITRIVNSSAARAGLKVGDVVVSIDGETVPQRIARLQPYLAASTPAGLRARLETVLLTGAYQSRAQLVVRGADGAQRPLSVRRSIGFNQLLGKHRTSDIIRVLPGNIGYIDLDRLPANMVDSAFRMLGGTKAIVLDDRGYPLGTVWGIAPRLNQHGELAVGAKFKRLVVASPDTAKTTITSFDQPIPPTGNASKYRGRTVMLIDERTISQAEHTGLFFEAANGTTFIGSPTMGANGDVTTFIIPGNIIISFTGHDVRHADGRQLQRVGLEPQVPVVPTIAGVRARRDEVLEAAYKYVGGTGELSPDTLTDAEQPLKGVPVSTLPPEPVMPGWSGFAPSTGYRLGVDRTVVHGGLASAHADRRSAAGDDEDFVPMSQSFRADDYRGKRVRFSAYVKTREMSGIGASIWMRVDGNGGTMALDNMQDRRLLGTSDWTYQSVVLDVPADADGIVIGLIFSPGGDVWMDDASFEVVGNDVPAKTVMAPAPNPAMAAEWRSMYARAGRAPVNLGFEPPGV